MALHPGGDVGNVVVNVCGIQAVPGTRAAAPNAPIPRTGYIGQGDDGSCGISRTRS